VGGQPLDVFIASDDSNAATALGAVAEQGGLRPIQVGPLRRARELESMGFLHMTVQQSINGKFSTALKIIT
jgi:8-hydroxy-5-deazaflavin:NADPH oxidoreductase